jgi:peptide deformylase
MSTALLEYPSIMIEDSMELSIRTYPNPVLTQVAEDITNEEFLSSAEDLVFMGKRMIALMQKNNALGLATNQVGLLKRMFVMTFPNDSHDPMKPLILSNPVIVEESKTGSAAREGCLSLPNVTEQVWRPDEVWVQYKTPYGEAKEIGLLGMEARIALHEIDHLNGMMFTSRMSRQMRKALLAKYEKLQRRK